MNPIVLGIVIAVVLLLGLVLQTMPFASIGPSIETRALLPFIAMALLVDSLLTAIFCVIHPWA